MNYPAALDRWPRKKSLSLFRLTARRKYGGYLARFIALPEYFSYTVGVFSVLDDSLTQCIAAWLFLLTLAIGMPAGWTAVFSALRPARASARELHRARLRAEKASAAKSLFLAVVSHEIRTLLYGMLASIELIGKTRLDEAQAQLSAAMACSARTLKDVLNNTLDFTRNETEAVRVARQEFDLCRAIESTVQAFGPRAAMKGLQLQCRLDPALAGLWWGDSLKLMQILNNLLNNAVKFTAQGGVTVNAELVARRAGGGADIAVSVRDTGPGIPACDVDGIFGLFVRTQGGADAGRAGNANAPQPVSGTGLGLYICRQFAAAMGGAIELVSTSPGGSVFALRLAMRRGGAPAAARADTSVTPDAPAAAAAIALVPGRSVAVSAGRNAQRKPNPQVLIVDDQPINRLLLEKQLQHLDCRVTAAAGGPAALADADGKRFDLILTDLNMPELDGYALARAWRAGGVACPIVAISAGHAAGERERCMAAGMNGCLAKPFTMDELEQLLTQHLGCRSAPRGVHAPGGGWRRWEPDTIRIVVATLTSDLDELADCAANADIVRLGKVVHRIHGGMALLEIRPAAALCQTIEACIEFAWMAESMQFVPALREMLMQIRDDIDPDAPQNLK